MKTAKETLNTIAVNNGHKDWLGLTHCEGPITILNCTIEAMELYAELSNSHKPVVSGKRLIEIVEEEIKYAPTISMKNHLRRILEAACASGAVDKTVSEGLCHCVSHTDCECIYENKCSECGLPLRGTP